jgi:uncharacterized tellurite resistance protein B-like protein
LLEWILFSVVAVIAFLFAYHIEQGSKNRLNTSARNPSSDQYEYDLICEHCEQNKVTGAQKYLFMHGFAFWGHYGENIFVGCRRCIKREGSIYGVTTLFFGWWWILGLAMPLIVIYNLYQVLSPIKPKLLESILQDQGIDPDELILDQHGLTKEKWRFLVAMLVVLKESIWADGRVDPREIDLALRIAEKAFSESLPRDEIKRRLTTQTIKTEDFRFLHLSQLDRSNLWLLAAAIVQADGVVHPKEKDYLKNLMARLQVPRRLWWQVFEEPESRHKTPVETEPRDLAARILGVSMNATPSEIKKAYRRLVLKHHPDRAGKDELAREEAHRRMIQINDAYRTIQT